MVRRWAKIVRGLPRIDPWMTGFGLLVGWSATFVRLDALVGVEPNVHTLFYGLLGAVLLVMCLALVRRERDWMPFGIGPLCAASAALMVASVPLVLGVFPLPGTASVVLGCALGAVGYGVLFVGWGCLYALQDTALAVANGAVAFILHAIVNTVVGFLPTPAAELTVMALPLTAGLFLVRAARSIACVPLREGRTYGTEDYPALWKIALGIFLYGLLLGMRKGLDIQITNPLVTLVAQALLVLFYVAVWLWTSRHAQGLNFSRMFQVLLIIFATGFLFYPLCDEVRREYVAGVFSLAVSVICVVIWLAAVDVARHSSVHPGVVVGLVWFLYSAPRPLGALLSDSLAGQGELQPLVLSLVMIYCVVITTAFLLGAYPPGIRRIFEPDGRRLEDRSYASIDDRCGEVGRSASLTDRELDIMRLLCRGRTKAYIAETLMISENTVKSYTKNLYLKLGIHSREELLDLVQEWA